MPRRALGVIIEINVIFYWNGFYGKHSIVFPSILLQYKWKYKLKTISCINPSYFTNNCSYSESIYLITLICKLNSRGNEQINTLVFNKLYVGHWQWRMAQRSFTKRLKNFTRTSLLSICPWHVLRWPEMYRNWGLRNIFNWGLRSHSTTNRSLRPRGHRGGIIHKVLAKDQQAEQVVLLKRGDVHSICTPEKKAYNYSSKRIFFVFSTQL